MARLNKLIENIQGTELPCKSSRDKKIYVKPRHPFLQTLAGTYTGSDNLNPQRIWAAVEGSLGHHYDLVRGLESIYSDDNIHLVVENRMPDGRKFGKWLGQNGVPERDVQSLMRSLPQRSVTFEVSIRHKDLLRLVSRHYATCLRQWRGSQMLRYLADPDVAVAIIRDRSGDFLARMLMRLVKDSQGEYGILANRCYGNGLNWNILASGLKNVVRVYTSEKGECGIPLYTVSKDYIGVAHRFIWEDSKHAILPNGSIRFYGSSVFA